MATTSTLPLTSARRAWLAIGVPVCLVLIASTGLNLVATLGRGSFPVSYTFPAGAANPSVSVGGGQILVKQAAGPARITGTAHYSILRAHIKTGTSADGSSFYNYDCVAVFGNCALDATLTVPPGQTATAATGGGNAMVTGTTGNVTISTAGGQAVVSGTTGDVTVSSGGGDLSADHASGRLTMRTDGGQIHGAAITAPSLAASTGGGDITITFTAVPRHVDLRTSGGNITLVLPRGATYHVTASTDGGNVTDNVTQDTASPNVITATSGGGDIRILQS